MSNSDSDLVVAIWMVTYNHENYIEQAIESVMMQKTTFNYKLFIGEDCSTDSTRAICLKLKGKYPDKIELQLNEENLGHDKNGLVVYDLCYKSKATYIAMLEGDDYWMDPLKLQKQIDFLEDNVDYSLSFTRFKVKEDDDRSLKNDKIGHYFKNDETSIIFDFKKFETGWYGGLPTLVFRAKSFNLKLTLKYSYFRDVHLFTELLKKGKGVCLNFFGSVYRIHKEGIYSSSTIIERAKIGSLCYKELYFKNEKLKSLEVKYRFFHKQYINALVTQKRYVSAFWQAIIFGFKMNDFGFMKSESKKILKNMKVGKIIERLFYSNKKNKNFVGSGKYWEQRYKSNKDSGAGSYGRLAAFKAEILNQFVTENNVETVLELGCGDGNQLSLAKYPKYIGFDVSNKALEICRENFKHDATKVFYNSFDEDYKNLNADLTLSLDVIYHLIEDEVFENYMNRLFSSSTKYVIIYSSNYNKRTAAHVRSRKFTDWIAANVQKNWTLINIIKNRYPFDKSDPNHTSMADFYIYEKQKI